MGFCEISLISMSLHLTDNKSTGVQVIAWYHQAMTFLRMTFLFQCNKSLGPPEAHLSLQDAVTISCVQDLPVELNIHHWFQQGWKFYYIWALRWTFAKTHISWDMWKISNKISQMSSLWQRLQLNMSVYFGKFIEFRLCTIWYAAQQYIFKNGIS